MDNLSIFCFLMYRDGNTLEKIGEMIGRHHATVINHLERYHDRIQVHKGFKKTFNDFRIADFVANYKERKIYLEPLTVADVTHFLIH
ncbi:hypothetical protein PQ459_10230 [Chryseobacterium sp. KACC 21268]|nr:hypothetical protein PQ459_10230 [Chryseobacterium sp. KACC 21268]